MIERDAAVAGERERGLFEVLTSLLLEDTDPDLQLAAARALQTIAEADPESAAILNESHSMELRRVVCWHRSRQRRAIQEAVRTVLRAGGWTEVSAMQADGGGDAGSDDDEENAANPCVICLRR